MDFSTLLALESPRVCFAENPSLVFSDSCLVLLEDTSNVHHTIRILRQIRYS